MNGIRSLLSESGARTLRDLARLRGASSLRALLADHSIEQFHMSSLGILTVGSRVGDVRVLPNGGFEQRYTFGSITKPLGGPPIIALRYQVTIDIAAIRCFGTEDPSGTDEPYVVAVAYGLDPLIRDRAVQTNEIHFGEVHKDAIFAAGRPLMMSPITIPGDGSIHLILSLWDEEKARPRVLQEKWRDAATAAILSGLTLLNPAAGATAAALETAKGIVTDAARELITFVSDDLLGIADDHIGTHEFSISSDYLRRLFDDGGGMPRTSPSIQGINYNFPELPETEDPTGHSWLFEGGGGSYRIFLSVRVGEPAFSPSP